MKRLPSQDLPRYRRLLRHSISKHDTHYRSTMLQRLSGSFGTLVPVFLRFSPDASDELIDHPFSLIIEAILRHPGLQKPESKHMLALIWAIPAVDLTYVLATCSSRLLSTRGARSLDLSTLSFHFGCDWAAWRLYQELGWYAYKKVRG